VGRTFGLVFGRFGTTLEAGSDEFVYGRRTGCPEETAKGFIWNVMGVNATGVDLSGEGHYWLNETESETEYSVTLRANSGLNASRGGCNVHKNAAFSLRYEIASHTPGKGWGDPGRLVG